MPYDEGLKFGLFLPTMRPYNSARFVDTLLQEDFKSSVDKKIEKLLKRTVQFMFAYSL